MCCEIRNLQQSSLFHACEIGNVAEIPQYAPSSSKLPELPDPDLRPFIKSSFGKYHEASLLITQLAPLR